MIDDFEKELNARVPERKQRGRPRRDGTPNEPSRPRAPKLNMAGLKKNVEAALVAGNMLCVQYVKNFAFYQLQPDELAPLSEALAGEIAASPKISSLANKIAQTSPHLALLNVLASMALTRYAIYQSIKGQGPNGERNPSFDNVAPPVSDETRRAYSYDWQDGERQDLLHIPIAPVAGARPQL